MNGHALVIGETLIDEVRSHHGATETHVGGSPGNVAVGLTRLGRNTELLTWIGQDSYGRMIREHLESDGVHVVHGSESAAHTSIATAVLDKNGQATYKFDLEWAINPMATPSPEPTVVHTGSIAAVIQPGADDIHTLIERNRTTATITYDPNSRPTLMGEPQSASDTINGMVERSDVVKVSDEDLQWLNPDLTVKDHAKRWLEMGPEIVVVTRGGEGASGFTKSGPVIDISSPKVTIADTVGAGDSFTSGLIDGLWRIGALGAANRDVLAALSTKELTWVLTRCVKIAAITVSRAGANPPTLADLGEA